MNLFLTADASVAAGGSSMIIMLVLMFAIFYFLIIRPENKKKKKTEEMRNSLSLGDEITTIGGIIGSCWNEYPPFVIRWNEVCYKRGYLLCRNMILL